LPIDETALAVDGLLANKRGRGLKEGNRGGIRNLYSFLSFWKRSHIFWFPSTGWRCVKVYL